MGMVSLLAMAVGSLYVPGVLNWVADLAMPSVENASGLRISIGDLSLKFPLDLTARNAQVLDAAGDTMVVASRLSVRVDPLALLTGDIGVSSASLDDAVYRMGAPDSLYLRAVIDRVAVHGARIDLSRGLVDVDHAALDGGGVNLVMGPDSTASVQDTTVSMPWVIRMREVSLRHVDYAMSMLPVIDTLTARVESALLADGMVDMARKRISAGALLVDSVGATYFTPDAEYMKAHQGMAEVAGTAETPVDGMWTVTVGRVSLTSSHAVYGVAGSEPQPGLDMNYLQVGDVNIQVDSLWNRGAQIRVPLTRLSFTERSGLDISASGLFEMDSVAMRATGFRITTLYSSADVNAVMGLDTAGTCPVMVDAAMAIGLNDVMSALPALRPVLAAAPVQTPVTADVLVDGTMDDLCIQRLDIAMQRCFSASLSGRLAGVSRPDEMSGRVSIDGRIVDTGILKPTIAQARMGMPVAVPPLRLDGVVDLDRGNIDGRLTAHTGGGRVALDAGWKGRPEAYRLKARVDSFPVRSFLPALGVGAVTASVDVSGRGLDFLSPASVLDANVGVGRIEYENRTYGGIDLVAAMADGRMTARLTSNDPAALLDVDLDAGLSDELYTWSVTGDVKHLDLRAMGFADTVMQGGVRLLSDGRYVPASGDIMASLEANDFDWMIGASHLKTPRIKADFSSDSALTRASVVNRQLSLKFNAPMSLDSLLAGFARVTDTIDVQIARKRVNAITLQQSLPEMNLAVTSGSDNLINDYLSASGISFRSLELGVRNDSALWGGMRVTGFNNGDAIRIDTMGMKVQQFGDSLIYAVHIDNRPGTMDEFAHVLLDGSVSGNYVTALVRQRNISGKTGYRLGLGASISEDSVLTVSFRPFDPVIAYKAWVVNPDNFIAFDMADNVLTANLDMSGNGSRLQLSTAPGDSIGAPENVLLKVTDVKLSDWMAMSPFAPPVTGSVSADMRMRYTSRSLWGNGSIGLTDLTYGRDRVGSFDLGVDVSTNTDGVVNAEVALMIDGIKTITAVGSLNDSTKADPFDLDFSMIKLPLRVVNPFLPKGTARMSGMLNGNMQITGTLASPVFNGYIDFDSSAVNIAMLGTDFRFSEEKVRVDSNLVMFEDFAIRAVNDNPLRINGTVDMNTLSMPRVNLRMDAVNMQVTGGRKRKGVDVYGNTFVNLDATVRGNLNFMAVDADVKLLRSTNVTYIMADAAPASLGLQDTDDMVRFVNFTDSVAVAMADTIVPGDMAIMVDATLEVEDGATVNVDLSSDSNNKVQVQGGGTLQYSLSPLGDSRVTGRLNINQGFVRYTPPFISEKLFKFRDGSYVAFNGDMMNPILNIHADETLRANVTREGENSRLVNFDVGLSVTGSLQSMNVAFDLSTNDDITVQNELQSMSTEQRANQAMNMLLYNVYTGPGAKGNSNLSGNPLFSFLESQLNSWAANNIKGVDVSFGIDQYSQTRDGATSSTMSYSYQVSKSLFNDRFKIVVGGNYSTDADADENFSQNLINDISFEYMLNRSGSMYVKLFRHTGYESILEGEITQTGVGFVYKRKLRRLGDMFKFMQRRRGRTDGPAVPAALSVGKESAVKNGNDEENETE